MSYNEDSGAQVPPARLVFERCEACGQLLAKSDGCPEDPYPTAFRWGREPWFTGVDDDLEPLPRCPDCWALVEHPHHFDCIRAYCELCDDVIFNCAHAGPDPEDPPE